MIYQGMRIIKKIIKEITNILRNLSQEDLQGLLARIREKYEAKILFCRECGAKLSTESERNRWDKKGERICELCIAVWQADLGLKKAARAYRKAQRLTEEARRRAEQETDNKRVLWEEAGRLIREEAWLRKAYWLQLRYAKAVAAWDKTARGAEKKKAEKRQRQETWKKEERTWKRARKKEEQRRKEEAEARRRAQEKERERRRREEEKAREKAQREAEKARRKAQEDKERAETEAEEEAEELSEKPYREYYRILGLSEDATLEEIKKAYYKGAKRYHPDMGGDVQRFKRIQEAYEVLLRIV